MFRNGKEKTNKQECLYFTEGNIKNDHEVYQCGSKSVERYSVMQMFFNMHFFLCTEVLICCAWAMSTLPK